MLTLEELIIATVRVLGSIPVLRWAFVGAILAILFDLSDLFLKNLIDLGGVGSYQTFDKWLDLVYMGTFLMVALRWNGLIKRVAIYLFMFRMIGFGIFEFAGEIRNITDNQIADIWGYPLPGRSFFVNISKST